MRQRAAWANFWRSDGFLGLIVCLVMLIAGSSGPLRSLELAAYDLALRQSARSPSDRVAVIAIDQHSIDNIGRWPWSREVLADLIDKLTAGGAKVIGTTIFLAEPQQDAGLSYIRRLTDIYQRAGGLPIASPTEELALQTPPWGELAATLKEAESKLDADARLARSLRSAGNVALPMLFATGDPLGRPDKPLPDFVRRQGLKPAEQEGPFIPTERIDAPVLELFGEVATVGQLNLLPDPDGAIRTLPLFLAHFDEVFPALALQIAAKSLNLGVQDLKLSHDAVRLGKLKVPTAAYALAYPHYYASDANRPPFAVDSFFDVLTGKVPVAKYRDKIVLIGSTAAGIGSSYVTPVSSQTPSVLMLAHNVSAILGEHFYVQPTWAGWAESGLFLLVALYLTLLLPRLNAGVAATLTFGLLLLLIISHFVLMIQQMIWLQLMLPAVLLLVGHLALTTKKFFLTERGKEKSEAESAESNRMLALAFQGQGQLDMAFDKFRKCPLDDGLMENLYNLALDFERKRQFNKAEAVFRYMADYKLEFRDLPHRLARAKQLSETVMLGAGGGRANASTLIVEGGQLEKPMLGRYQVEKELGKGAMGVVYLGRDPKINRVVAIKTMALSQEFDEDELVEVKERFFREAETAGRLNHPNIVTIFDAGEEHDLAYIAMEFLKGHDLVPQTKPEALLPLPKVLDIVARVAEALDYAHRNNVVHRDIKPANIMYEPVSDQVKVTDFGIARITDSSKTKTGMVLGTPSYMSPEQLAGNRIDGRSDLFSLGVTLFQLICGQLPFSGDSMAQLMFRIANEPPADIRQLRPDVPPCLVSIIDRALCKDVGQRYQTGGEMARDLRLCLASLGLVSATSS